MDAERIRRTVVVGVDGSTSALRAVRWGAAEAARRRVPLRLVTAFGWAADRVGEPGDAQDRYREILLGRVRIVRGTEPEPAEAASRPVVVGVDGSATSESAVGFAWSSGRRGRGEFAGLVLGSVSNALLHRAECPVAVARDRTTH